MKNAQLLHSIIISLTLFGCTSLGPSKAEKQKAALTFETIDKNGSQTIHRQEFFDHLLLWAKTHDRNKDDMLSLKEVDEAFPWIQAADKNGNGLISLPELMNAATEAFAKADADKSKTISPEEFKNFQNK